MEPLTSVDKIVLHHTGRNNDFPGFIRLRHRFLRGWDDIGYHFLIGNDRPFTLDGKLYRGRNEHLQGAHARGHNHNTLAVCLIGNFDIVSPTTRQMATLFRFLDSKMSQYELTENDIIGHDELPGVTKSCPGEYLDMDFVRAVAGKRIDFVPSAYEARRIQRWSDWEVGLTMPYSVIKYLRKPIS